MKSFINIKKKNIVFFFLISFLIIELFNIKENKTNYVEEIFPLNEKLVKTYFIGNKTKSNITIVGLFFNLKKNKHDSFKYKNWSVNFMMSLAAPLILFCDEKSYYFFKYLGEKNKIQINFHIYENIWLLFSEIEIWRNLKYRQDYQNTQYFLDPEKQIHNPNLYAIWNSKHYILKKATELNPFGSNFFIYTDIGAWREKIYKNWPDTNFIFSIKKTLKKRILYGQINAYNDSIIDIKKDNIEGTFFAGEKSAIEKITQEFYSVHDDWFKKGIFVGKDQTIMNFIAYYKNPKLVKILKTYDLNCSEKYDKWFFYQNFFSKNYSCKEDRFSIIK